MYRIAEEGKLGQSLGWFTVTDPAFIESALLTLEPHEQRSQTAQEATHRRMAQMSAQMEAAGYKRVSLKEFYADLTQPDQSNQAPRLSAQVSPRGGAMGVRGGENLPVYEQADELGALRLLALRATWMTESAIRYYSVEEMEASEDTWKDDANEHTPRR